MTADELDQLALDLETDAAVEEGRAERTRPERLRLPPVDFAEALRGWQEGAERTHGRARATRAHWSILGAWCARLYRIAAARKRDALVRALDNLEEARRYEASERTWTRFAALCARRVSRAERAAVLEERRPLFGVTVEDEIDF